jgi:phosphohistidine phosphatase
MHFHKKTETQLILLRHAHSAWPSPGQSDFDRNIDSKGRLEAAAIGRLADSQGYLPLNIICSSATRCKETVGAFITHLAETPQIHLDKHLYDGRMGYYLEIIEKIGDGDRVLIAGHNPMIEETFKHLAGDSRDAHDWLAAGYPTAGMSVFRRQDDGSWHLEAMLAP